METNGSLSVIKVTSKLSTLPRKLDELRLGFHATNKLVAVRTHTWRSPAIRDEAVELADLRTSL